MPGTQETDGGGAGTNLRGALRSLRLVWKINGLFLLILASALGVTGYLSNADYEQAELEAARDLSRVSSQRILQTIRTIMASHQAGSMREVVSRMASENPAYRDVRLISHAGRVVVSQETPVGTMIDPQAWPCSVCHADGTAPPDSVVGACCEVVESPSGERALSAVTPIYREPGCSEGECHSDQTASPIIGLLQADFSLARIDALIHRRNQNTLLAILISLVLGMAATWWMTERLLGRRIRALKEGAARLAEHDFSFRFQDATGDGLAEVVGVFDSMTSELSDALSELMSTKEYLQAIVDNSADIIITVDPEGFVRTFNPGAEKILGYGKEEIIGERIERLFADPEDREAAIRRLENGDHVVNYMTHFVTKDGDLRNVMLTLSRLRAPDGTPMGTMGISKDITEELRLQVQLLRSKRLAALGEALTGIQHSIKNMLNAMKGGSYMVGLGLKKDDKEMLTEGWEMVREGIDDMTQMSMSMLDFARTRKLSLKPVDLAGLARKAHQLSLAKFQAEGVELLVETQPDLPEVVCDVDGVRSVVMDLLSNALDACSWKEYPKGDGGRVVLRVLRSSRPDFLEIQVQDNGEGMTEDVRKRVFVPFFSTKEKQGTGMGLAVVSRIVESHGGETFVESEPGKGATFRVLLPVHGPTLGEEEG